MTRPALRSRSLRKVTRKTPGGKPAVQYKAKRTKRVICPKTGQALKGVARKTSSQMKSTTKSQKRSSRPFGGNLSPAATRATIKARARSSQ